MKASAALPLAPPGERSWPHASAIPEIFDLIRYTPCVQSSLKGRLTEDIPDLKIAIQKARRSISRSGQLMTHRHWQTGL